MKENKAKKRAIAIVVLPVMLVLVILNLGLPQQYLSAITVGSQNYSVADYNYYFYTRYYDYCNTHADNMEFDLTTSLKKQAYSEDKNWQEYFHDEALSDIHEVTILNMMATDSGYELNDENRVEINDKQDEIYDYCADNSIAKEENYYTAMYDAGMTKATFFKQFEANLIARDYKKVIMEQLQPSQSDITSYIKEELVGESDYAAATIGCIFIEPGTDRSTGETTKRQWSNCETRAENILKKFAKEGATMDEFSKLAMEYSKSTDIEETKGIYEGLIKGDLSDEVSSWSFDASRQTKDTTSITTDKGIYILYYDKAEGSALEETARRALVQTNYEEWLASQEDKYPMQIHKLPMQIAR